MRKRTAAAGIAAALTIFPTSAAFADGHVSSAPQQEATTDDDDGDKTGLWGLLGLAGLAGLAGLKRRDRNDARGTNSGGATQVR
jgi:MYXO-CTERM domain-containing protein